MDKIKQQKIELDTELDTDMIKPSLQNMLMNTKETSIHIVLMVNNLILIALKIYSLLQVTQILQKMKLKVF